MAEPATLQGDDFMIECEELEDPSLPIRQGDVLEWLDSDQDDLWRRFAIVVTADCDLAYQKHAGLLACVPLLPHEDYLALFPLPARLGRAKDKLLERTYALVRGYQAENRPDYPLALSDQAIASWIDSVGTEDIIRELQVNDQKRADELTSVVGAIRGCSQASAAGGFSAQLDALATALIVTQGKSTFDERRSLLARELLDQLGRLPGDAIFLHALSPRHRQGYVAYLRALVNVQDATVARSVRDLNDATTSAKRIARLGSPYVFHLTQALGHVFSAIGLPSSYEESRDAFITQCGTHYGGSS
jgi:hypothetical protein